MEWSSLFGFTMVASLLVVSSGPNGVLIAKTVPISGRAAGFANVAGFVAAFYLHGALSILGISVILVQSATAFFIVKMLGAAYLCWIGIKALREAFRPHQSESAKGNVGCSRRLPMAFVEGLATNALNPKVSMFYLAAFPQFIPTDEGAVGSAFLLVVIHSLLNAVWFSLMVLMFGQLTKAANKPYFQRWLKGVTGIVFLGFGAKLATFRP